MLEKFNIPPDEYPICCEDQVAEWETQAEDFRQGKGFEIKNSYDIIDAVCTGNPAEVYGNVANFGLIDNLPIACAVEVPCLVDHKGVRLMVVGACLPCSHAGYAHCCRAWYRANPGDGR